MTITLEQFGILSRTNQQQHGIARDFEGWETQVGYGLFGAVI